MPSPPRVLVTGASGFIGSHVTRTLAARGSEVHAVSRERQPPQEGPIRWWRADLTELDDVERLLDATGAESIVHLASHVTGARGPEQVLPTFRNNVLSSLHLMIAAVHRKCRRVVLGGSMDEPAAAESAAAPQSPYAAAKWASSGYGRMFRALYGLDVVRLRIAMVYGPGQKDTTKLVPYVIRCLLDGVSPEITSGTRAVDWIYVEDVAEAVVRACFTERTDESAVDIASGRLVTIRDVVERLAARIDPAMRIGFGARADRPLERAWLTDTAHTEALLDWKATTSLDDGLDRTIAWYRANAG
jgi:nucleoside-diphosphate-sugar epimerase